MTPTTGQVAKLTFSVTGGQADWNGPGINWTLNADPKLADVSNWRDGRTKNETLPDATVNVTYVFDGDDPMLASGASYASALIGAKGTAKLYVNSTKYITFPFVIGPEGIKNDGMENDLMVDLELSLSGSITWPTFP